MNGDKDGFGSEWRGFKGCEWYVIGCVLSPLGYILDSNRAELMAIKMALDVFSQTQWLNKVRLIIESDSFFTINWCVKMEGRPWRLWDTLYKIDAGSSGGVEFMKVQREANCFADSLAKSGVGREKVFMAWW
ncbi:hypothetical protein REPUB_Repub03eG0059600 [Reevesia pubescens]